MILEHILSSLFAKQHVLGLHLNRLAEMMLNKGKCVLLQGRQLCQNCLCLPSEKGYGMNMDFLKKDIILVHHKVKVLTLVIIAHEFFAKGHKTGNIGSQERFVRKTTFGHGRPAFAQPDQNLPWAHFG